MAMNIGKGDDLNSEINVTPFVDVMLVLLVIFMITAPMMTTGVDITLPPATAKKVESAQDKLILSIDRHQVLRFNKNPVRWVDLEGMLKANPRVQKERLLYIEAHKDLPYAVVVTAMATAQNAGVDRVMMLTDPADNLPLEQMDDGTLSPQ